MNKTTIHTQAVILFLAFLLLMPALDATAARTYAAPEEAANALAVATKAGDVAELRAILGPGSEKVVESGDAVADTADRAAFSAAYAEKNALVPDETQKDRYFLEIGANGWPFPAPLVLGAKSGRWHFDGKAGEEAVLVRRIGHNELAAIEVSQAVVDAQREYWRLNPQGAAVPHYAAAIRSTPGKRDGLYWESGADGAASPLGKLAAAAEAKGYTPATRSEGIPYFGYHYRILPGQGQHAPGGALNYTEKGLMTKGFALLAYPDRYGVSGVMCFMINQDGLIYEKNFGKNTNAAVPKVSRFDPDGTWSRVDTR